jgi:hypothetical protein
MLNPVLYPRQTLIPASGIYIFLSYTTTYTILIYRQSVIVPRVTSYLLKTHLLQRLLDADVRRLNYRVLNVRTFHLQVLLSEASHERHFHQVVLLHITHKRCHHYAFLLQL